MSEDTVTSRCFWLQVIKVWPTPLGNKAINAISTQVLVVMLPRSLACESDHGKVTTAATKTTATATAAKVTCPSRRRADSERQGEQQGQGGATDAHGKRLCCSS